MPQTLEANLTGRREQLADYVALVDEKQTPLVSLIPKSKQLTNTQFDFVVDSYAAPVTTAHVDGQDVTSYTDESANKARLLNYVHYLQQASGVSTMAQEIAHTPSGNLLGEAKAKATVEMKRSMEAVLLSSGEMVLGSGAVGSQTRGLGTWISTSAQSLNPVPAAYRPASAQVVTTATASLAESDLQNVLASIFDTTGMTGDYKFICGSVLRRRLTDMTTLVSSGSTNTQVGIRTFDSKSTDTITKTVTVYNGDYGSYEILSSNFIGWSAGAADTDRGYVLDFDKLLLRYHTMPRIVDLPNLGGGQRFYIESIFGLQVSNPIGLAKFQP